MAYAYSAAAWIAAHTALKDTMLDDTGGEPTVNIYDSGNVLLASVVLDDVASAVSGTTGDLTIEIATQEDAAPASGTASYALFKDGSGASHLRMDCKQGTVADAGWVVMNTLSVVSGAPVDVLSISIPAGYTIT